MPSIAGMLKVAYNMVDTDTFTAWEEGFLVNMWEQYEARKNTLNFTEKQVEVIERLYEKATR